jgi:VCBS repeat-containing protein
MRSFRKTRQSDRQSTSRRDFLRVERLEVRWALATASPVAVNDFYHDLVNQPLDISTPGVLANDTSASGAAMSAGLFSGPAHGTVDLSADGSFHYVPNADYLGLDSFLYVANDGASDSMLAAVTIDVGQGGPPPEANDDSYSLDEDGTLDIASSDGVLANDVAAAGESLAASVLTAPTNGTLTLAADGSLTYVPSANFNGTDSFTYNATDSAGDSAVATASITINPVNDKPVAGNDAYSTAEDNTLTVDAAGGLLANDADIDGDTLVPTVTLQPVHGSVNVNADGSFSYTPDANYNGLDGFSYLVSDGTTTSDVASATIMINSVNDLPVGVNDQYTTPEDTPLSIAAPGVLTNDTDVDGDALSSILVNPPQHGQVTLGADGSLLYSPTANFNGVDGFSYTAGDGSASSDATAVTVNVTPVNDAPISAADSYMTPEDTALTIDAASGVLANDSDADGDPLSATVVTGPTSGTLTLNPDGSFNYAPSANFNGSDSFTYQASDGTLTTDPTTVTIGVCPVNDAPTTADDAYSLDQGTTLTVDPMTGVLANDSDIDGDPLTSAVVTQPANGTLSLNPDGSFSYTPNASFSGTDSFTYAAGDGNLTTPSNVTLTVNPVAQAPVPAVDNYSTGEDVPLVVGADLGVLANDVSPDGSLLTAQVVTGPAHGSLTLNPDGSFSLTPEANFHGSDSFTYKAVSNGQETVSSANIVVEPLNDAPTAADDQFAIDPTSATPSPANNVIANNVTANDTDIDGEALAAILVSGPAHGMLTLNSDGTFNYVPQTGFSGDDTFRYQDFDGKANSNVATVTLHVPAGTQQAPPPTENPPPVETPPPAQNQPPTASNDVFTTPAGTTLNVAAASGLLANDSDPEGAALTASLFADPLHGTVSVQPDGSFSYTPSDGYSGTDAFLYRVNDGTSWSPLAAVTIHVTPSANPDPAPTPAPTPSPAPQPTPDPCQPPPCHEDHCHPEPCHSHDWCHAVDSVLGELAHGHLRAIGVMFGHHGWNA